MKAPACTQIFFYLSDHYYNYYSLATLLKLLNLVDHVHF